MLYADNYIKYLLEFHTTRDFFECHELLEEYWKEHPDDGLSDFWVALIQVAVGQYHERRGNVIGGMKMYSSARQKLEDEPTVQQGIQMDKLLHILTERIQACHNQGEYEDINLPLESELEQVCLLQATGKYAQWGIKSDDVSELVINRHTLRDRSEVIEARSEALLKKQAENMHSEKTD